jgi:hypothetical protein
MWDEPGPGPAFVLTSEFGLNMYWSMTFLLPMFPNCDVSSKTNGPMLLHNSCLASCSLFGHPCNQHLLWQGLSRSDLVQIPMGMGALPPLCLAAARGPSLGRLQLLGSLWQACKNV